MEQGCVTCQSVPSNHSLTAVAGSSTKWLNTVSLKYCLGRNLQCSFTYSSFHTPLRGEGGGGRGGGEKEGRRGGEKEGRRGGRGGGEKEGRRGVGVACSEETLVYNVTNVTSKVCVEWQYKGLQSYVRSAGQCATHTHT